MATQNINDGLHLARGMCAIGVVTYHYLEWKYGIDIRSAGTFLVYAFFSISSLTMMMSYEKEFNHSINAERLFVFYRKRLARILPLLALVACVAAAVASFEVGHIDTIVLSRAILTGTGLFGLQMPGLNSGAVAAWSLGIEILFYLLFPLVALSLSRISWRGIAAATAILVAGQQAAILIIRNEDPVLFFYHYANLLVFAPFFAIGILIHRSPLKPHRACLWSALLAFACIATFSVAFPGDLRRTPVPYILMSAAVATLVLSAHAAILPRWLASFGKWAGDISYALYLTHWFAYRASAYAANKIGAVSLQPVIFAVLALTGSYLLFRYFEAPTRDWLRGKDQTVPST